MSQTVYTFTNAGATGPTGPTQAQITTAYQSTNLAGQVTINTQGIQEWVVPSTGQYEIEAWGDGTPIRDFVYGGDVADAILDLYEKEIHTTINFGAGEEITIKSMIEQLIEISGKNISIKWDTSKPNGDMRRQMDTTKQTEIGLLPKLGFKEALRKTYNHYINGK